MVKITRFLDIWKVKQIPEYIAENMEEHLFRLCKEHITEDITDFGMFCYIENADDLNRYAETGLSEPFDLAEPATISFVKDRTGKHCCVKASYTVRKDYTIYVYCDYEIIRAKTSNHPDTQSSS